MSARLCKEPGCNKPIFQNTSQLCQYHNIQQRYKNATAKKPVGTLIAGPGSKPIKKKSLYNFKLDDDMKQLKRKRPAPAKRSVSYGDNALPVLDGLTMVPQPQKLQQQGQRILAASDTLSTKAILQETPEQGGKHFSPLAGMGSDPNEDDLDISLGSASMAESPISLLNAGWEGDYLV
jgi:hypothetical protein